jgi:hypothetical protein
MCTSYKQAYDDASISMKMKERMERDTASREIQKRISDKLLCSLMADHRKHISRCRFWMGKAQFEQGDYESAMKGECFILKNFIRRSNTMFTSKNFANRK